MGTAHSKALRWRPRDSLQELAVQSTESEGTVTGSEGTLTLRNTGGLGADRVHRGPGLPAQAPGHARPTAATTSMRP